MCAFSYVLMQVHVSMSRLSARTYVYACMSVCLCVFEVGELLSRQMHIYSSTLRFVVVSAHILPQCYFLRSPSV